MSRLEVCPWCNELPKHRFAKNEPDKNWWQVYCDNPKCPIQPYTDFYINKGVATRVWNKKVKKVRNKRCGYCLYKGECQEPDYMVTCFYDAFHNK